jgi:hypothetical protein
VEQQRLAESLPPPGPANAEQVDVARVRIDVVGLAERERRELVPGEREEPERGIEAVRAS